MLPNSQITTKQKCYQLFRQSSKKFNWAVKDICARLSLHYNCELEATCLGFKRRLTGSRGKSYYRFYEVVTIEKLFVPHEIRRQGKATEIMNALCIFAEMHGAILAVNIYTSSNYSYLFPFFKSYSFILNTEEEQKKINIPADIIRFPTTKRWFYGRK